MVKLRVQDGFIATIMGIGLTVAVIVCAWSIFPNYEWWQRDLSTLGRIFIRTANGKEPYYYFSVYNFALLIWGISCIPFWGARALLMESRGAVLRTLICGLLMGLGVMNIGITPADAPTQMHVVSSMTAILAFCVCMFSLKKEDEPFKWQWLGLFLACIPLYFIFQWTKKNYLPYGSALFQKSFVLLIFAYMVTQSVLLYRQVRGGVREVQAEAVELAKKFGAWVILLGPFVMLALMLIGTLVFPGHAQEVGFNWQKHWMSIMGNIFLTDAGGKQFVYRYFMIYNGALSVGGIGMAMYWFCRSLGVGCNWLGRAVMIVGLVMGAALTGIGMAPSGTLKLHRFSINMLILTVVIMLILLLLKKSGDAMKFRFRVAWLVIICGLGLFFSLNIGGRPVRIQGQKILVLATALWLASQGFSQLKIDNGKLKIERGSGSA